MIRIRRVILFSEMYVILNFIEYFQNYQLQVQDEMHHVEKVWLSPSHVKMVNNVNLRTFFRVKIKNMRHEG